MFNHEDNGRGRCHEAPTPSRPVSGGSASCGAQTACCTTVCRTPRAITRTRAPATPATSAFACAGQLWWGCRCWHPACAATPPQGVLPLRRRLSLLRWETQSCGLKSCRLRPPRTDSKDSREEAVEIWTLLFCLVPDVQKEKHELLLVFVTSEVKQNKGRLFLWRVLCQKTNGYETGPLYFYTEDENVCECCRAAAETWFLKNTLSRPVQLPAPPNTISVCTGLKLSTKTTLQ
ncbi:hypothetical protein INR49_023243 [Caranx melampygus]|nr:hypothetical protein INR49_023243 [Caranx melampygus]